MRLIKHEFRKITRYGAIWFLFAVFLGFNIFLVYNLVGDKDYREMVKPISNIVSSIDPQLLQNGAELESMSESDDIYEAFYASYAIAYSSSYDMMDMNAIKESKQEMTDFYPTGWYKEFIDSNYDKLQQRVEEIKATGEDSYPFYPGHALYVHKNLFREVMKFLLIEMMILAAFSVLYIMDNERIHKTTDIVFSSRAGRKILMIKWLSGMASGLAYSFALLAATVGAYFAFVPMKGMWRTPISSFMLFENSGLLDYPFITFVRLEFWQYLMLYMITALLLAALIGAVSGALQLFINNSYISAVLIGAGFFMMLALPLLISTSTFVMTLLVMTPAALWFECSRWFIENDIPLSFAWSEFYTIGAWSVFAAIGMILGWRRSKRKDVV